MSNEHLLKVALAEHQEEQRRKQRGLMSDQYNLDCSRNPPLPEIDYSAGRYTPKQDNGERNRRSDKVSDPVNVGIDATLNERGSRYGVFTDHAAITQGLKSVMKATPKWAALQPDQKEALEMVQHKIGRILNGDPDYHDSWHDIVGYAKLVADRLEGVKR